MPRLFLVDDLDPGQSGLPDIGPAGLPTPDPAVSPGDEALAPPLQIANVADRAGRLRSLVERYIDFVARVLRNAGTPQADIDDEVQRTFIIAARRIDDVRPGSEKSFLLQTALHLAAH